MLSHKVKFTLGDPSDDGHGKYEDFYIKSSLSVEELKEAYKKAKNILGITLDHEVPESWSERYKELDFSTNSYYRPDTRKLCVDYQENKLSVFVYNRFKEQGIDIIDLLGWYRDEYREETEEWILEAKETEDFFEDGYIYIRDLFLILMAMFRIGNAEFDYEVIKDDWPTFSAHFGYGCFD